LFGSELLSAAIYIYASYVTLVDRLCYPYPHGLICSYQTTIQNVKSCVIPSPIGYDFLYSDTIRKNIDREYHFYVANCYKYEWNIDYFALTTDGRNLTKFRWSNLADELRKSYPATSVKISHYVNGIFKNFCNYLFMKWDLLRICTACKLFKFNCPVQADCTGAATQMCKKLLCKLTKCKKCSFSIIINQTNLYNLHCCCIIFVTLPGLK
jgi:hypothetical protein